MTWWWNASNFCNVWWPHPLPLLMLTRFVSLERASPWNIHPKSNIWYFFSYLSSFCVSARSCFNFDPVYSRILMESFSHHAPVLCGRYRYEVVERYWTRWIFGQHRANCTIYGWIIFIFTLNGAFVVIEFIAILLIFNAIKYESGNYQFLNVPAWSYIRVENGACQLLQFHKCTQRRHYLPKTVVWLQNNW